MKKMTKLLAASLAALTLMGLTACGASAPADTTAAPAAARMPKNAASILLFLIVSPTAPQLFRPAVSDGSRHTPWVIIHGQLRYVNRIPGDFCLEIRNNIR